MGFSETNTLSETRNVSACGAASPPFMMPLLSIHVSDKVRHGISDSCESLPMAVPRVDPKAASKMASVVHIPQTQAVPRQLDVFCALLEAQ